VVDSASDVLGWKLRPETVWFDLWELARDLSIDSELAELSSLPCPKPAFRSCFRPPFHPCRNADLALSISPRCWRRIVALAHQRFGVLTFGSCVRRHDLVMKTT
jgi:hypothetical protein